MPDLSFIASLLTFLGLLSILIIAHEMGHFWVARRCGIKVERFGFGMPVGPVLWSKKIGEVEYCIHLLLLGGYVSFPDDNPDSAIPKDSPQRFENQPLINRFAVAIAGVTVNALLAWVIMAGVYMGWGGPKLGHETVVLATVKNEAAHKAGIHPGDIVKAVDGQPLPDAGTFIAVPYFTQAFESHKNGTVLIGLERQGKLLDVEVRVNKDGKIGFIPEQQQEQLGPVGNPLDAIAYSVDFLNTTIYKNFVAMGQMVTGRLNPEMLSGPIEIVSMGSETIEKYGIEKGLMLTAIISMILAVMNLLPIPALDGGHILFILIEAVKGSPLRKEVQERFTQAGFIGLMVLMVFILYNDSQKLVKRYAPSEEGKKAVMKELITAPPSATAKRHAAER
ncbi:MAG: RIP metalloprotease RseP [Vampirovibrionales bacterium]|nr:RIP metalloprotease RseP [Vampirovibrionales bacterium]